MFRVRCVQKSVKSVAETAWRKCFHFVFVFFFFFIYAVAAFVVAAGNEIAAVVFHWESFLRKSSRINDLLDRTKLHE